MHRRTMGRDRSFGGCDESAALRIDAFAGLIHLDLQMAKLKHLTDGQPGRR